ncbi:MAG TPA: hypothetical protein VHY91_14450 [Pirellulales bacterium]|jgi:hypothetical protein|nr:hypothetical protein [Pirellulales bacterium]
MRPLLVLILLVATPALGAIPQAEREAIILHRAQVKQEARLRDQFPAYYAARQAPQTQVNIYAPTFVTPVYGYPTYVSPLYGGYGYGRPAWPPSW